MQNTQFYPKESDLNFKDEQHSDKLCEDSEKGQKCNPIS